MEILWECTEGAIADEDGGSWGGHVGPPDGKAEGSLSVTFSSSPQIESSPWLGSDGALSSWFRVGGTRVGA